MAADPPTSIARPDNCSPSRHPACLIREPAIKPELCPFQFLTYGNCKINACFGLFCCAAQVTDTLIGYVAVLLYGGLGLRYSVLETLPCFPWQTG